EKLFMHFPQSPTIAGGLGADNHTSIILPSFAQIQLIVVPVSIFPSDLCQYHRSFDQLRCMSQWMVPITDVARQGRKENMAELAAP
ncbi:hypothetical protein PIB30_096124, partial [Stylosanthes scabra]|nr:hypothetical protein [Stylosanthes scabra]